MSIPERRAHDSISKEIKQFVHDELEAHEARERAWFETYLDAFPERDIKGHHDYHESKIKAAKAEEAFWNTAKTVAIQQGMVGVFAVLRWVAVLAVVGFAYKFGFGPVVAKIFGVGT